MKIEDFLDFFRIIIIWTQKKIEKAHNSYNLANNYDDFCARKKRFFV